MLATYMPRMLNNNLEIRIEGPLVAPNNKVFRSPPTVVQCLDLVVWVLRVVTKISSCRVFVVSSRGSRKQSWRHHPPRSF